MCIVGDGQIDSEESIQSHPTSLKLNITPNVGPLSLVIRSRFQDMMKIYEFFY